MRRERDQVVAKYDALIDNILRALGGLSLLGSRPGGGGTALAVVDFPATWVAYTRYQCYWKASKLFISRRAELLKAMDQAGLEPVEVNMAIFHSDYKKQFSEDPSDNEGDLEVCYRVKHPGFPVPPLPADPRLPGGDLPVRRPLCGDAAAYLALEDYAQRLGLALRGTSLEEYLVGATMTADPQNYVTRIYLPIQEG